MAGDVDSRANLQTGVLAVAGFVVASAPVVIVLEDFGCLVVGHDLLGDDGVGHVGEAEVGAADKFEFDAWAASVVVGVTGIAGHVADADDLHAEEVVQAVAVLLIDGGAATAHGT